MFFLLLLLLQNNVKAENCYHGLVSDDLKCSNESYSTVSGGAYPLFSETFNLNPASIPVVKTPIGVEAIVSVPTQASVESQVDYNFALIKGFERIGAAIASNSDRTFYTYNLVQSLYGSDEKAITDQNIIDNSIAPNLNIGSALGIPMGEIEKYVSPSIGGAIRFNQLTKKWDNSLGLSINSKYLSIGISSTNHEPSGYYPGSTLVTYSLGLKISYFHIEYSILSYEIQTLGLYSYNIYTEPVNIITASFRYKKLMFTGAQRSFTNFEGKRITQLLISAQYLVYKNLSLAYLYNYIPGSQSLGIQFFL